MAAVPSILALIPAYQAGPRVGPVVTTARAYLPVVVVDDGSTDDTAVVAEHAGATVLRQVPNAGKGAALRAGFRHALEAGADAVVTLDADGQHDPDDIPAFLAAFAASRPELVLGTRDFGSMPPVRRLSNTLGGWVFSAAVGRKVADNQSGYRLVGRRLMAALLDSDRIRLRVRGRDDRPVHRARSSDRRGADPDDLCRRAQPHPAVAPLHGVPAGHAGRPADRPRRLNRRRIRPSALAPVRDLGDEHVRVSEQRLLDPPAVLVVEQPLPPVARHVLGQQDDDEIAARTLCRVLEVPDQRPDERAVRRLDDDERHAGQLTRESIADPLSCARGRR